jgi:hypothetical protein
MKFLKIYEGINRGRLKMLKLFHENVQEIIARASL